MPYSPRPARFSDTDAWRRWLVNDQRTAESRPDVLTYMTPALTEPVRISGAPVVHLVASTSGTDSDWVVKLIDVYPDEVPSQPEMGGYQLAIAMDIFRGRYRESFERPAGRSRRTSRCRTRSRCRRRTTSSSRAIAIMVQVQSTLVPALRPQSRRRSCRTSFSRSRRITSRPRSASTTRRRRRATSICRSSRARRRRRAR